MFECPCLSLTLFEHACSNLCCAILRSNATNPFAKFLPLLEINDHTTRSLRLVDHTTRSLRLVDDGNFRSEIPRDAFLYLPPIVPLTICVLNHRAQPILAGCFLLLPTKMDFIFARRQSSIHEIIFEIKLTA